MSNFAPDLYIHIKSNFINLKFNSYFYVRFKERKAIGRLQLG